MKLYNFTCFDTWSDNGWVLVQVIADTRTGAERLLKSHLEYQNRTDLPMELRNVQDLEPGIVTSNVEMIPEDVKDALNSKDG